MATAIERPLVESMVPCRELFENARTGEFVLVGPFNSATVPEFPVDFQFSVYLKLVNGQGRCRLAFELLDESDDAIWDWTLPAEQEFDNPLEPTHMGLYDLRISIPNEGRYLLVLLVDGKLAGQSSLVFHS
jgi:hypothetical protein